MDTNTNHFTLLMLHVRGNCTEYTGYIILCIICDLLCVGRIKLSKVKITLSRYI